MAFDDYGFRRSFLSAEDGSIAQLQLHGGPSFICVLKHLLPDDEAQSIHQ